MNQAVYGCVWHEQQVRAVAVGLLVRAEVEVIGVKACDRFNIWCLLKLSIT